MPLLPLLLAVDPERAADWLAVIRRSHRIELLASLDLPASGVEGLDAALRSRPDAAAAVWAAGEREASAIAERLVEHGGPCLLHPPPARPPEGDGRVQVTHGWLSLSGVAAVEQLFAARRVEKVRLLVRGTPEGPAIGIAPALYHAAALVSRFGREVVVRRAVLATEDLLSVSLRVDGIPWQVEIAPHGCRLELVTRNPDGEYGWIVDGVSETLQRPRAEPRAVPLTPWADRCIRQLEVPVRGATLADARRAHVVLDQVEASLERPLPPNRIAIAPITDSLAPLGLIGDLPAATPLAPTAPPRSELPLEAIAYALDLKPAVFLTVAPQDEARVRAKLPGHVERRERHVDVGPGDRWTDARDRGTPAVELYAARDPDTLRRLVQLQMADPSRTLDAIGALLGYPACCVQAFGALGDRSDNSYNRLAAAARTSIGGPWPALLDDTALKLLPHFVCTYRCERSLEQVQQLLDALADEHRHLRDALEGYLVGPVLYFDHDHQIRFRGEASGLGVRYSAVSIPWSRSAPFAALAGAIAQGDRLALGADALTVFRGDAMLFSLRRTDPHVGILMPFAR